MQGKKNKQKGPVGPRKRGKGSTGSQFSSQGSKRASRGKPGRPLEGGPKGDSSKSGGRRRKKYAFLPKVAVQGEGGRDKPLKSRLEESVNEQDRMWREQKPSAQLMGEIMSTLGVPVDDLQLNLFWQFHLLLRKRNKEINLTRIHSFVEIVIKHFVDCGMVGGLTDLTGLPGPLMDLGSGGGFPGVPLKILYPDVPITLAEGRRLRVEFLEEVRKNLRLPQLYITGKQIHPSFTEPMGGVITRAVELVGKTLTRVSGCVQQGGRVILMKGPNCGAEIIAAKQLFAGRFDLLEDHKYTLPGTDHKRRLLVYIRLDCPAPNQEG